MQASAAGRWHAVIEIHRHTRRTEAKSMFNPAHAEPASAQPDQGFQAEVRFADVPPDVLAQEAARERRAAVPAPQTAWAAYLGRVLPSERESSAEASTDALMAATLNPLTARAHAAAIRRQALAMGDLQRVRFWDDVVSKLDYPSGMPG